MHDLLMEGKVSTTKPKIVLLYHKIATESSHNQKYQTKNASNLSHYTRTILASVGKVLRFVGSHPKEK